MRMITDSRKMLTPPDIVLAKRQFIEMAKSIGNNYLTGIGYVSLFKRKITCSD